MKNIRILDCTLRDGGYCNQWNFGEDNIKDILSSLSYAPIDIIECGFITNKSTSDPDVSKYKNVERIRELIPKKHTPSLFVAMINYGEFDFESLPDRTNEDIGGIRLAFHKKNIKPALEACKVIKSKGYKVFIQAMVTMTYSDSEFLQLIEEVNSIDPYAFYIVDSFGNMRGKDLMRYYSLTEHNLSKNIAIGFHSHNNLQLASSNAKLLVEQPSDRELIVDTSVYGMGRGAGNLNTELFTDYLNNAFEPRFDLKPIIKIMDGIINKFYLQSPWGYNFVNYLSAINNAHPNYAGYFSDIGALTHEEIDALFKMMDSDRKVEFDKEYAKETYIKYMESGASSDKHIHELNELVKGREVVLIAPGRSAVTQKSKVLNSKMNGKILISINFDYSQGAYDFIFVSNMRRFEAIPPERRSKCVITSNIHSEEVYACVDYKQLINEDESVYGNAGLMAIKLLIDLGAVKIDLAGFDGYSHEDASNYADSRMTLITKNAIIDDRNEGMIKVLKEYSKTVPIEFLTDPVHLHL